MELEMKVCTDEDEEGDKVTVRSAEEFAVLARFLALSPSPVHIYPAQAGQQRRAPPPAPLRIDTTPILPHVLSFTLLSLHLPNPTLKDDAHEDVHVISQVLDAHGDEDVCIGRLLDECTLRPEALRNLCVLGSGHCGTVYKAVDTDSDRLMAVKCVSLDVGPEIQSAILNELRILHKVKLLSVESKIITFVGFQCSSPFVVDFYGALFVETQMSICMEFMDGGSLDGFGALPLPILGQVTLAAVHGLSYLWNLRIMHRDVKPSNILVNRKGEVKLADFGVSAQLESSIAASYVGTNAYMAPERVVGGEYRVASDVWALGLTVGELALGRYPLDVPLDDPLPLLCLLTHPAPLVLPTDLPPCPQLTLFLAQCLHKKPQHRLQPESLLQHPYILLHSPSNHSQVAEWLAGHLPSSST